MDSLSYVDLDGNEAEGVVWSPGPLRHTLWVQLAAGGAEAVVVRVPVKPDEVYRQVEWSLDEYVQKRQGSWLKPEHAAWERALQLTRLDLARAPQLPRKHWRAAVPSLDSL